MGQKSTKTCTLEDADGCRTQVCEIQTGKRMGITPLPSNAFAMVHDSENWNCRKRWFIVSFAHHHLLYRGKHALFGGNYFVLPRTIPTVTPPYFAHRQNNIQSSEISAHTAPLPFRGRGPRPAPGAEGLAMLLVRPAGVVVEALHLKHRNTTLSRAKCQASHKPIVSVTGSGGTPNSPRRKKAISFSLYNEGKT